MVVILVSILNTIIHRNTMLQNIFCFLYQVSSVSLASEDPVDEDSVRNYYLGIADYFFTGFKVRKSDTNMFLMTESVSI